MTLRRTRRVLVCALVFATAGACSGNPPTDGAVGEVQPSSTRGTPTAPAPSSPSTTATTTTTTTTTTTAPAPPPVTVDVVLHDYAIGIAQTEVDAEQVTLTVTNTDRAPHDVVVISTTLEPGRLPVAGIRVDEENPALSVIARTPRLPAGGAAAITVALAPGRYVLVCTVPHHYVRESMVATLTIA